MTMPLIDEATVPARRDRAADPFRETHPPRETRRAPRPSTNVDQVLDDSFPASDPPSWSGAISRVADAPGRYAINEPVARRIRAEFLEMPGLCLTSEQAQRLWSLEPRTCELVLKALIDARFLRRTDNGRFVLSRTRG